MYFFIKEKKSSSIVQFFLLNLIIKQLIHKKITIKGLRPASAIIKEECLSDYPYH